jgi:hypothetical protein
MRRHAQCECLERESTDRALQQRKDCGVAGDSSTFSTDGSLADVVVDLVRIALVKLVPGAHHTAKKIRIDTCCNSMQFTIVGSGSRTRNRSSKNKSTNKR